MKQFINIYSIFLIAIGAHNGATLQKLQERFRYVRNIFFFVGKLKFKMIVKAKNLEKEQGEK